MEDGIPLSSQTRDEQHADDLVEYWRESVTCKICGEPSLEDPNAFLCARCKKVLGPKNLTAQMKLARFNHMQEQWKHHAEFRCHYTGVRLELYDRDHVLYREWDHATPGNEDSVVLASAIVNRMKCYLNADEFGVMVAELARHFEHPQTRFDGSAFPNRSVPRSPQT